MRWLIFCKKQVILFGLIFYLVSPGTAQARKENPVTEKIKKPIAIHKEVRGEKWLTLKGETLVDAPLHVISFFFKDIQKSTKFTPGVKEKRVLEKFSESDRIEYCLARLPWPFRDRYTVYRAQEFYNNDHEILLTMNSVEDYPFEGKGMVLGTIKNSHFILSSSQIDKSKTYIAVEVRIDPGGWLPHWLVRHYAGKWPGKLFKKLKKHVRRYLAKQAKL